MVVTKGVILLLYFDVGNAVSSSFNGIKKKNFCSFFRGVCCVRRVDESTEGGEGASSVMK